MTPKQFLVRAISALESAMHESEGSHEYSSIVGAYRSAMVALYESDLQPEPTRYDTVKEQQ